MQKQSSPVKQVACFFQDVMNSPSPKDPLLLMGINRSDYRHTAGSLMPPCDLWLPEDGTEPVDAARRIGRTQTDLIGTCHMVVGQINTTIEKTDETFETTLVMFTYWQGKENRKPEFWWDLKFSKFSELEWGKAIHGTKLWMEKIFIGGTPSLVTIRCGENRRDVLGDPQITIFTP